jgi:hypothetical protein
MVGAALPGLSDHIAQELGEGLALEQDDEDDEDEGDEDDEDAAEFAAAAKPERQGRAAAELPSVEQLRALGGADHFAVIMDAIVQHARAAASMKDITDSKRDETAGRAANPRQ